MDTCTHLDIGASQSCAELLARSTRRARKVGVRTVARLTIQRKRRDDYITLRIEGKRGRGTLVAMNRLRSAAFLAIGEHPTELCLDLTELAAPLEATGIETLVTLERVAQMMNVQLFIVVADDLDHFCRRIGLGRLILPRPGQMPTPTYRRIESGKTTFRSDRSLVFAA